MDGMGHILSPSVPIIEYIFFGSIKNAEMQLSAIGQMAEKYWHEIPEHFPFVKLGAFVVMPDHIHGIIIIDKEDDGHNDRNENLAPPSIPKNKFGPQSKNLASIVRGYKIGVTKNAKQINTSWKWQSLFHDHIIRNNAEYQRIENYIINNPLKMDNDKFN